MDAFELGRVNCLDVQVVHDLNTGKLTAKSTFGDVSKDELSDVYGAGIVDFALLVKIKINGIIRHFGLKVKNPEIVPREDFTSTKAEYVFTIEERQVVCV